MQQHTQKNKGNLLKQFEQKMKSIDQISRLAIQQKQKKITEKYGNIQSTAKILKSLIIQFTKKSIKLQQELRQAARIDDLKYQTQYHTKRLEVCLKLSQNLQTLIGNKKSQIQKYQAESRKLKQDLIVAKTANIKKILKIQMLQNMQKQRKQKEKKDIKNITIKQKMYQNRMLMQTGLTYTPTTVDLLKKQKQELQILLWQKINKKLSVSKFIFCNYEKLKQKLIKQQKKSNIYGLNGSLFFKLQENIKLSNTIGKTISRKNKFDHKLLIYDVLKQKYSNQIKQQQKLNNQIKIDQKQFMNFTPIQILGLIQLKGGIRYLRNNQIQFFSYIKQHNHTSNLNKTNSKIIAKNFITLPIKQYSN